MLGHARLLDFGPAGAPLALDVVGTGGDQAHTVNISTMSALVCAAAGAPVIKHGNRAASSSTGTADVLEALGVAIDLEPEQVVASVREAGFGFCFAPIHHPAMRFAGPTRRELGVPTVFNVLGPLTNPGGARAALIGCALEPLAPVMADVLAARGVRALVVRGEDGLDEVSTAGATRVWDATGGSVVQTVIDAGDLGIPRAPADLLRGGLAPRNAALLRMALGGPRGDTWAEEAEDVEPRQIAAIRDAVALNAACALVAFRAAQASARGELPDDGPLIDRVARQLPTARDILERGDALTLLENWATVTRALRAPASEG
jgi:anthranilate phosphoribosyltransferase